MTAPPALLLHDLLTAALLLVGGGFMLLAAVGLLRLPDVYLRLSAVTKSATVGVSSVLAAVALGFADGEAAFTALLAAAFFFLTAPVAGHMIGRAAYFAGVPLWEGTRRDELRRGEPGTAPASMVPHGEGPPDEVPLNRVAPDGDAPQREHPDDPAAIRPSESAGAATAAGTTKGDLP